MVTVVANWFDTDRLIRASETDDEVGTVLRMHLAIDAALDHYVAKNITDALKPYIPKPRYTGQKISLAAAFGLPLPFIAAAYEVNTIRNGLAHTDAALSSEAIHRLATQVDGLATLDPKFAPLAKRYVELPTAHPGRKFTFGEGGPRLDFLLASFTLLGELTRWMVAQGYAPAV